jgi:hypothetical protein
MRHIVLYCMSTRYWKENLFKNSTFLSSTEKVTILSQPNTLFFLSVADSDPGPSAF